MGILAEPIEFMQKLKLPKGFSVCELGDQFVTAYGKEKREPASELYKRMGCGRYVSIDGNGRATHLADLNKPLPWKLGRFDLVTDFGTGEHIFNQLQVWETIHKLCRPMGYIAFDRPAQGYAEHCYYNVHLCLFDDIAAANNYLVVRLERKDTLRGSLIRGVFRRPKGKAPFVIPQQGRYRKLLRPMTERRAK